MSGDPKPLRQPCPVCGGLRRHECQVPLPSVFIEVKKS